MKRDTACTDTLTRHLMWSLNMASWKMTPLLSLMFIIIACLFALDQRKAIRPSNEGQAGSGCSLAKWLEKGQASRQRRDGVQGQVHSPSGPGACLPRGLVLEGNQPERTWFFSGTKVSKMLSQHAGHEPSQKHTPMPSQTKS